MSESARLQVPSQLHSQSVSLLDLQSEIEQKDEIIRSFSQIESRRILDLGRSRCEKDDYEFQKNVLREECQLLAKLNEDLRELISEKSRELEKREKEHAVDLANFKKLCDEMVRNISEEKNRALSKLTRELKEKEIEYQVRVKKVPFLSDDLHPTEPNTAVTGLTENLEIRSANRHNKDSSISVNSRNQEDEDAIREDLAIGRDSGQKRGEREKATYQYDVDSIEFSKERNEQFEIQEKEIQILRIKIREVELERETLIERFKQQEDERVQRYEAKIQQLEENVKTLEKAALVQSEEQKKLQLEASRAESLKTETVTLKEEMTAKEKEAEGYRTEANILKNEVEMLKNNIENLKEVISLKEKEIEISQMELRTVKRNSTRSSPEKKPEEEEAEEASEAEKELEKLREYVAGFEAKLKAEEEKYQEMHKKYQKALQEEHEQNIAKIEEKANKYKDKKKDYKKKWNEIQAELKSSVTEKNEISEKVKELEESISKYSEKEEEHQKIIKEANEKKEELTKQIEALDKKTKELEAELAELKKAEEKVQKEHESKLEKLKESEQANVKELEQRVEEYRNTAERLEKELKEAHDKAQGADQEKEVLVQRTQDLERELKNAVEAKNNLEGSLEEVSKKLEVTKSEKEGVEKRIKTLEKKVSESQIGEQQHQQQQQQGEVAGEEASRLAEELSQAREEAQAKNNEIELLKKELQEKIGIIEEKEKIIKSLKVKIGIMNEQVDESERGAKDFESLRKTLRDISERLDVSARQDSSPKALTAILVEVKEKLQEIEGRLDQDRNKEANLRRKLEKSQSELVLAKENAARYMKVLEDSQKESAEKIEKLEKINADLELHLRLHQGKMMHVEQENVQIRGSLEKALQTLEFEKEGLKKDVEGHKRTLSNMTKDSGTANEALTIRVEELEDEKKQLEQELWNVKTDATNFVREIEFLKMELQRSHEFFQQEHMKLESRLREEQEEVRKAREAAKEAAAEAIRVREEWIVKEYGNESPVKASAGAYVTREYPQEQNNDGWVTRESEVRKTRQVMEVIQPKQEGRKIARNIPRFDDVEYIDEAPAQQEAPVNGAAAVQAEDGWITRDQTNDEGYVSRDHELTKTRQIMEVIQPKQERMKIARNIPRFDDVEYIDEAPEQKEEAPVSSAPAEDGWITRETGESNDGWVTRETEIVKTRAVPEQRRRIPEENKRTEETVVVDSEGYISRSNDTGIEREHVIEKTKNAPREERAKISKAIPCWEGEGDETYVQERVIEVTQPQGAQGQRAERAVRANLRYAEVRPEEESVSAQDEMNRLRLALREVEEDREGLRKKLMEIDSFYTQKLDEMTQELVKKNEHINALMFDVAQMKEWIVERHGDDVFEKDDPHHLHPHHEDHHLPRSGRDSAALSVNESRDEMSKSMTITIPSEQVNDEWAGIPGILKSPERKEEKKKKQKSTFSLSWKAPKGTEIVTVSVPENRKKGDRLNSSTSGRYLVSYSNSATPKSHKNSERGSVGTSDSKKERKPEAAYQQLEKMILELNEKLANADKRAKAEYTAKIEEYSVEAAAKEAKLLEEIEKMKEEKAALEKEMEALRWEHAYEIKKLLENKDVKVEEKESTPVNDAEKKDGEGKKKKKKKK